MFLESSVPFYEICWNFGFRFVLYLLIHAVPSKSNGYVEEVGGYREISIGTLNIPNAPPFRKVSIFVNPCQRFELYPMSFFLSLLTSGLQSVLFILVTCVSSVLDRLMQNWNTFRSLSIFGAPF